MQQSFWAMQQIPGSAFLVYELDAPPVRRACIIAEWWTESKLVAFQVGHARVSTYWESVQELWDSGKRAIPCARIFTESAR